MVTHSEIRSCKATLPHPAGTAKGLDLSVSSEEALICRTINVPQVFLNSMQVLFESF